MDTGTLGTVARFTRTPLEERPQALPGQSFPRARAKFGPFIFERRSDDERESYECGVNLSPVQHSWPPLPWWLPSIRAPSVLCSLDRALPTANPISLVLLDSGHNADGGGERSCHCGPARLTFVVAAPLQLNSFEAEFPSEFHRQVAAIMILRVLRPQRLS